MNYTILWQPKAERELAAAWVDAVDRAAVTAASDLVEFQLRIDPRNAGESRDPGTRVLFIPPLVIAYEVIEDDRRVNILGVRLRERF